MKHLNNKGMTIIEILACFIIVVIITSSLFVTLNNYKSKQQLESDRMEIIKYKNLMTKEIQDDLIKKNLKSATVEKEDITDHETIYTINLTFKDDSTNILKITKYLSAYSDEEITEENDINDYFSIEYNNIKNTLPNIGYSTNQNDKTVYDLKFNNINIKTSNNILSIYIGFYHPNFGKRYAIDIVCPINYQ